MVVLWRLFQPLVVSIILGTRATVLSQELGEARSGGSRKGLRGGEVGDKAAREEVSVDAGGEES